MEPVRFFNRLTNTFEIEQIYGERWLRLTYESPVGSLFRQVVKRPFFSRWYGWLMARPSTRRRIGPFVEEFGLDPAEFAEAVASYRSFNDFFVRKLKPGARPIDPDPASIIFPSDGRHLGFPDVSAVEGVFVKGQQFDLPSLLGSAALADRYARGSLVISRLCPTDYHRYHFPISGLPSESELINGPLFSVSPLALRRNLSYLWRNKRVLTSVQTEHLGTVLCIEVGATNVGSITQTFTPGQTVLKGDERGYFSFGGSTTITLFEPGRVELERDLLEQSANQVELYAPMGSRLGVTATAASRSSPAR